MDGALRAIQYARVRLVPFLGNCGGFQHALIEFARNVLLIEDADSAEHNRPSDNYVVVPVASGLVANPDQPRLFGPGEVLLEPGSLVHRILGCRMVVEQYYCSFEANPHYVSRFHEAGLRLTGFSHDGIPRIAELARHPFFVATQFQPQLNSTPEKPHPLIVAFLRAATR
jgi:CTP synthase (UTP-ammonia lyase)